MNEEEFFKTYKHLKKEYFMRIAYKSIAENRQLQSKLDKINEKTKDIRKMIFDNYGLLDKYGIEIVEDDIKDIQKIIGE